MTRGLSVLACLLGAGVFALACGSAKGPAAGVEGKSQSPAQAKDDGTYASHSRETQEFFERGLSEDAADGETRFGEYLTVLEINPADLQAMMVDVSFKTLHDAAMRYPDARIRRQMMLAYFGEKIDQ